MESCWVSFVSFVSILKAVSEEGIMVQEYEKEKGEKKNQFLFKGVVFFFFLFNITINFGIRLVTFLWAVSLIS